MPQNVRNFWLELDVDGSTTRIATGPRGKEGGFRLRIFQRDKDEVTKAAYIDGVVVDGKIRLRYELGKGEGLTVLNETER